MMLHRIRAGFEARCGRLARGATSFSVLFLLSAGLNTAKPAAAAEQVPSSTNNLADPADFFAIETWTTEHGLPQTKGGTTNGH